MDILDIATAAVKVITGLLIIGIFVLDRRRLKRKHREETDKLRKEITAANDEVTHIITKKRAKQTQ
jgi:hypothetical protein